MNICHYIQKPLPRGHWELLDATSHLPRATAHLPRATGRLPRATGRFVAVATWHRASATRFVARESGQRQRNGQKNRPGGQFPWIFDEIP